MEKYLQRCFRQNEQNSYDSVWFFYYAYQQLSDINVYNYGEKTRARVEYINSFRRKINAEPKFYFKYQFLADGKLYKNQVRFFPEFEGGSLGRYSTSFSPKEVSVVYDKLNPKRNFIYSAYPHYQHTNNMMVLIISFLLLIYVLIECFSVEPPVEEHH